MIVLHLRFTRLYFESSLLVFFVQIPRDLFVDLRFVGGQPSLQPPWPFEADPSSQTPSDHSQSSRLSSSQSTASRD